jgi:DNA-binding MarR family transcriptional regulator
MINSSLIESNAELLVSKVNHSMVLIRRKELTQHHIAPRQLYVLHVINDLGPKATAITVAKEVDREVHVINRLLINLEKDGFIERNKNTPKSKLLSLKLTKKGLDIIKLSLRSKSIDSILSFLPEQELEQMESALNKVLKKMNEYIHDSH